MRLQGTRLAVALAGPVAYRVVFHHAGPRGRELPTIMLECLPGWAAVGVTGVVVSEVFAREGPVGALDLSNTGICGSIPRSWTSQFSISAGGVADQALGI